jgi:hypothetical protein
MRKPALFLRIAAVLTFVFATLHTIGGVFGEAGPGPASVAVQAMKINQFPLMGHARSYWDFYRGLGLGATISLTAEAFLFWYLGSLAKMDERGLRPILVIFSVAYAMSAVNSYVYLFVGPVIAQLSIAACLGLAILTTKSQRPTSSSRAVLQT